MHCVSSYPLEEMNVNFPKLIKIKNLHNKIGYSGHLHGIDDAIAAISLGAMVVGKHFTIDNDLPGRDNKFAILPGELKTLRKNIDRYLDMIKAKSNFIKEEVEIRKLYTSRWIPR